MVGGTGNRKKYVGGRGQRNMEPEKIRRWTWSAELGTGSDVLVDVVSETVRPGAETNAIRCRFTPCGGEDMFTPKALCAWFA